MRRKKGPPTFRSLLQQWEVGGLPDTDDHSAADEVRHALFLDHIDGMARWSATRPSPSLCFFALMTDLRNDMRRTLGNDPPWSTGRLERDLLDEWFFFEAQGRKRWPTLPGLDARRRRYTASP